jgi:GTPase
VPIFNVSSVTREGIETLSYFISQLKSLQNVNPHTFSSSDPIQFDITDNFQISGFGTVVNGMVRSGTIRVGQQLYLGPDTHERFTLVNVRSVYLNRVAVTEVVSG